VSYEVNWLLVKDLADRKYPFLYADDLGTKARAVMRNRELRVLPIVDEHKRLLGVVSRMDIMTITSSISPIRVKGIMSTPKFVATMDMNGFSTLREMIRLDEWYVPVTVSSQDSTYTGMFGLEAFIRSSLEKDFTNLSKPLFEIMSNQLLTCSPEDEVDNIWRLMQERSFAGLPVVKKGKLIGMVTQKDLLDTGAVSLGFEAKKGRFRTPPRISSIMKTSVESLEPQAIIKEASELMLRKNIGRVPIVDEKGKLVGIVDREDIARALL